jgi:hypothetical protein
MKVSSTFVCSTNLAVLPEGLGLSGYPSLERLQCKTLIERFRSSGPGSKLRHINRTLYLQ